MFKIPEWESSVPAPNLDFLKEIKKKQPKSSGKKEKKTTKVNGELNNNDKIVHKPNGIVLPKNKVKKQTVLSNGVHKKKNVIKNNVSLHKNLHPKKKNIIKTDNTAKTKENKQIIENKIDTKVIESNKRKHENNVDDNDLNESFEMENFDTDKLDEAIINAKKKKLKNNKHKEEKDVEEMFIEHGRSREERKKQLLKSMLNKESHRNTFKVNGNNLRERMLQRLKAAQFRYLNEKLYTSSGSDAKKLFDEDPNAFRTYHEGYQQQVKKWPVKPLDVIVKRILKMPKSHLITDMGCGEGALSRRVPQSVRSFDLVAFNPHVEVCDIAHTPLLTSSMNVAVYCLALMGTDLTQYIVEANRVLKKGGHLLIAEVESRFDDVDKFINDVQRVGFSLKDLDKSNNVFYFMEFVKVNEPPKKNKLPFLSLKPCFYKKR